MPDCRSKCPGAGEGEGRVLVGLEERQRRRYEDLLARPETQVITAYGWHVAAVFHHLMSLFTCDGYLETRIK